jgi:four helix bundle protein
MRLEELEVYRLVMGIGERIWQIVSGWDFFAKDTVGKQFVRAIDSVAANLSEGFGRFHYNENRHFGYYGRGSLFETRTWLTKAHNRSLVSDEDFTGLSGSLDTMGRRLNAYIKSIGTSSTQVKENGPSWDTNDQ